ncbi:MAG: pseudouridine synthase [Candidatus Aminicenantales bacterium]
MRLNKFLSQAGISSRREADRLIAEGRVSVNGQQVENLGFKIDPERDVVEVDGRKVKKQEDKIYIMLNKPPGFIVSLRDSFGRPTIIDLLPPFKKRLFPVGRLDYNSQGLLLLTNDGQLTFRLTHPRFKIKKVYLIRIKGELRPSQISRLEKGIILNGKKTAPARIRIINSTLRGLQLRIEIYEGRKREIRRMFEAIGCSVVYLQRIKFGPLALGNLKKGQWRYLTPREISLLKMLTKSEVEGPLSSAGRK